MAISLIVFILQGNKTDLKKHFQFCISNLNFEIQLFN